MVLHLRRLPRVPTRPDDVNKEGHSVPYDLPRAEFVHWVVVDLEARRLPRRRRASSPTASPPGASQGPAGPRGHAHREERLHLLVRRRRGHGGDLLRVRRALPALERPPGCSVYRFTVDATDRSAARWRASSTRRWCGRPSRATSSARPRIEATYTINPDARMPRCGGDGPPPSGYQASERGGSGPRRSRMPSRASFWVLSISR